MYIQRELERKFLKMNGHFKAILVTGARQVGKTTMLKKLAEGSSRVYVTLDNAQIRHLAKNDPALFFQTFQPPMIIDEIQYAPELFSYIKTICDNTDETGLFWLTGSQQYSTIKNVSESLAGRVCILQLYGMSQREKASVTYTDESDFSLKSLQARQRSVRPNNVTDVFNNIWQGGMPGALHMDAETRGEYYNSYVNTYLLRDAIELGGITDAMKFSRFVTACAALIGQQVNYATLAESIGISQPTAKSWLSVLQGLGVVYLLQPFSNNALKRLAKTPKLYFCDTGLAAYLSVWLTSETLMNGAASGAFFENYVVMELVKNYAYAERKVNLTYYRDGKSNEIDILVEDGEYVHPLEVKKSASPDYRAIKTFACLDNAQLRRGSGGIVCMSSMPLPIDEKNNVIPANLL